MEIIQKGDVKVQVIGLNELSKQLSALMLSPEDKKKWINSLCKRVARKARLHTQSQTNLDGSSYAPRKHGKKKMERKITKFSLLKVFGTELWGKVAYKKPLAGVVARMQQEGIATPVSAKTIKKPRTKPTTITLCTPVKAKALIKAGYKKPMKGGKLKRVSINWLTENMSLPQATIILRLMTKNAVKSEWVIPLAARSFLGATQEEQKIFADELLNEILTGVKAGKTK